MLVRVAEFSIVKSGSQQRNKIALICRNPAGKVAGEGENTVLLDRFYIFPSGLLEKRQEFTVVTAAIESLGIEVLPFLQRYRNNRAIPAKRRGNPSSPPYIFILKGIISRSHDRIMSHKAHNAEFFVFVDLCCFSFDQVEQTFLFENNTMCSFLLVEYIS